ncbi:hypothetical protein THAOC_25928, partial [Thalassiosira oceanica]
RRTAEPCSSTERSVLRPLPPAVGLPNSPHSTGQYSEKAEKAEEELNDSFSDRLGREDLRPPQPRDQADGRLGGGEEPKSTKPNATKHGKLDHLTMANIGRRCTMEVAEECNPEQNRPLIPIPPSPRPLIAGTPTILASKFNTAQRRVITRREGTRAVENANVTRGRCRKGDEKSNHSSQHRPASQGYSSRRIQRLHQFGRSPVRRGVVRVIGDSAFRGCKALQEVAIPPSVTKLCQRAFTVYIILAKVQLQEGLEIIGGSALYECKVLQQIVIPSSVTELGSFAFYGCVNLAEVHLNEGLETIRGHTFHEG